jgi:ABC-type multidrug transport system ATPase subunit
VFQASDQRLRPVTMTVLTTVLGLTPLAVMPTESDQWSTMALVVIGGLLSSTVLTLLVIPCLYLAMEDVVGFLRPAARRVWRTLAAVVWGVQGGLRFVTVRLPRAVWRARVWRIWRWPVWAWRGAVGCVRGIGLGVRGTFRTVAAGVGRVKRIVVWLATLVIRFVRGPSTVPPSTIAEINRELPMNADRLQTCSGFSLDAAPLEIRNLGVRYPVWKWRDVARVIPSKRYAIGARPVRGVDALRHVNLRIEPGLFGLLGPNGAGKTTLLRCLAGLLAPSRGTVRIFGAALREYLEALSPLVAYLPQYHGLYGHMTLREFLEYFLLLRMRGQGVELDRDRIDRAVASAADEVHLSEVLDEKLDTFSGGMRQRAGLARVLLGAPPIVLVDEPTAGLDPVERVKVRLLLAQLARTRTVVFSTHLVEDLELSCRAVGILREGRLLYAGPPRELLGRLEGRIWEVPVSDGQLPEAAARWVETALFRVARPEGLRWRCVAPQRPTPDSSPGEPRLEDAFLMLLRAQA